MDHRGIYQHLKKQFEENRLMLARAYAEDFMRTSPLGEDNHGMMARAAGLMDMFNVSQEDAQHIMGSVNNAYSGPRPPAHN